MVITIDRTKYLKECTRGGMRIGSTHIGYTLEPPRYDYADAHQSPCIDEGEYTIELRNNPMAGTPTMKIVGKHIASNTSLRCCVPTGPTNASVVLLSKEGAKGDPKDIDVTAWALLLSFVLNARNKGEEVKLIIK